MNCDNKFHIKREAKNRFLFLLHQFLFTQSSHSFPYTTMIFTSSKFLGIAAAALLAVSGTQASFLDKPSVVAYWGQV
jgi:hypothetical protein